MCDPNTGRRAISGSSYARRLASRGVQLVPCGQVQAQTLPARPAVGAAVLPARPAVGAAVLPARLPTQRAVADPSADFSSTQAAPATPGWAVALIVIGSLALVGLIVVVGQIFILVKQQRV